MVFGLIKSRNVQHNRIAAAIKETAEQPKLSSIIHRIEDFFRELKPNREAFALLMLSFLDPKKKLRICIDRTEWDFGLKQINILKVIACDGKQYVPIFWDLLDNNSGNSNTEQRIKLVDEVLNLIGPARIGLLTADREFIGRKWFKYLKENKINFCIRIPKHHIIERMNGEKCLAEDLAEGGKTHFLSDCMVDGVWMNVFVGKDKKGELLFLAGTANAKYLPQLYKGRWTIECYFQQLKGRGFNLEETHMQENERLSNLLMVCGLAFAICQAYGRYIHEKVQAIAIKNTNRLSKSLFRYGLDSLQELLCCEAAVFARKTAKFVRYLSFRWYKYSNALIISV